MITVKLYGLLRVESGIKEKQLEAATVKEVLEKLEAAMTKAFQDVYALAQEKQLYMRDAAYVISINRVVNAVKTRGWV